MKYVLGFLTILSFVFKSEETCDMLVSDFSQDDCIAKKSGKLTYYYWLDESTSCIPTCELYKSEGYFTSPCPCPPGYECAKRCSGTQADSKKSCTQDAQCKGVRSKCIDMCVVGTDSCMAYHANTVDYKKNEYSAEKFKPSCDNQGKWKGKQCKGGKSGRCFCFDAKGKRLFGQETYEKSDDMTCECSRKKADLEASGRPYVSFHCDTIGNYEPLQCDSGLCWCVKPKTGDLTATVVPEKAMSKLPCFDISKVGSQYLRQCDSAAYAMAKISTTLKHHGVSFVNLGTRLCDGDGAFGAYNISEGLAYCTWRDGSKLGSWQSDAQTDLSTMNCNCGRDHKLYSTPLTCSGNGNYLHAQGIVEDGVNQYFCVDDDGFPKTDLDPVAFDEESCKQYF